MMTATPAFDRRRLAAITAGVVLLAIFVAFAGTVGSLTRIWLSSDTFSHGLIVVPVALWLAWRKRAELRTLPIRPSLSALPLLLLAGGCWLFGRLANANVLEHFAFVLMVQSALLVMLGWQLVRALAFPVLFLFFAVPFGEAFVPAMIDWTADFTVFALKLTGIPVYREGNNFTVPSGHWSVVEACSGIRYLIASVMAGTLFAYVMYADLGRRVAFIGVSILVPIVANWMRAYLIVLLGHLSNNEIATGVDHLLYGWLFFGVVLFAMFAIGARFRTSLEEDAAGSTRVVANHTDSANGTRGALVVAGVATLLVALPWSALSGALVSEGAARPITLESIPEAHGWRNVAHSGEGWRPRIGGDGVAKHQVFERDDRRVVVHIAYFSGRSAKQKLVSGSTVLVTSEPEAPWREIFRGFADVLWQNQPLRAGKSTLAGATGRFDIVWWYWVDGRVTADDSLVRVWIALSRLRGRGGDSAAVFLASAPAERSDGGAAVVRFAADMSEPINRVLVAARDGRLGLAAEGRAP